MLLSAKASNMASATPRVRRQRVKRSRENFGRNVAWMKDRRSEDVEARKAAWHKGVQEKLLVFEAQFAD